MVTTGLSETNPVSRLDSCGRPSLTSQVVNRGVVALAHAGNPELFCQVPTGMVTQFCDWVLNTPELKGYNVTPVGDGVPATMPVSLRIGPFTASGAGQYPFIGLRRSAMNRRPSPDGVPPPGAAAPRMLPSGPRTFDRACVAIYDTFFRSIADAQWMAVPELVNVTLGAAPSDSTMVR